jgi:hypothetical protein
MRLGQHVTLEGPAARYAAEVVELNAPFFRVRFVGARPVEERVVWLRPVSEELAILCGSPKVFRVHFDVGL